MLAEGLHTVDGVQRNPTDNEEQHNDGQVLCGLHFPFLNRAKHTQHCPSSGRLSTAGPRGVHRHDASQLKHTKQMTVTGN